MSTTRKRKELATMSATAGRDRYREYAKGLKASGEQCHAYGCGEHICVDNPYCSDLTAGHRCMCERTGEGEYPDLCEHCAADEGVAAKYTERKATRSQSKKKASGSRKAKKAKKARSAAVSE